MGVSASGRKGLTVDQELLLIAEYFQSRNMTVNDAFHYLDIDKSGYVSWDEFLRGVRHCIEGTGYTSADPAVLMPVFSRFDVNQDGRLSIDEFAVAFSGAPCFQATYYTDAPTAVFAAPPGSSIHFAVARLVCAEDLSDKMGKDVITRIASSLARVGSTPQDLFQRLDVDRNGRLSRAEIETVILGLEPYLSISERDAIWQRFDRDASGSVDLNEFYQALQEVDARALVAIEDKVDCMRQRLRAQGFTLKQAFGIFDRNADGFLSREEWQRAMSLLGPDLQPRDVEAVFCHFDVNQDGLMSLTEFEYFFQNATALRPTSMVPGSGVIPTCAAAPIEAPWESEVLDLVRECLSYARSGMKITDVFRRLDITGSNTMTQYEFNRMVSAYRPDLTTDQLNQLFYKVNTSRSGAITLGEFVRRFG